MTGWRGLLTVALLTLSLPACTQDGHLALLGYTTKPLYDPSIHTVYVPIFKNVSYRRGLEFELTEQVIREIESSTPFKIARCREEADTELLGKVINWRKQTINMTQIGEPREAEIGVAVELTWHDLRKIGPPGLPGVPPPAGPPVLVEPAATFIPELGGSVASRRTRSSRPWPAASSTRWSIRADIDAARRYSI